MNISIPPLQRRFTEPVAAGLFAACVYSFFLFQGEYLPDRDAYFHIKIAELLSKQGWVYNLPWMTESIHSIRYVDYHFLFHWMQVPFVFLFSDLIFAAKISTTVFCGATVAMMIVLLRELEIPHRWFWVLFFIFASPIFTGRLLFGRGVTLFLGMLFLFIYYVHRKKYISLAVLAHLSVWTYPGFPMMGMFVFFYTIANRLHNNKWELRTFLYPVAGFISGFVIHPAFPHQFYGFWLEFGVHSLRPTALASIAEWLPPETSVVWPGIIIPVLFLIVTFLMAEKQRPLQTALLLVIFFLFLSLYSSIKPFEYLIPFLTLFLALQPWDMFREKTRYILTGIALVLMLLWSGSDMYRRMISQIQVSSPVQEFDAAEWLKQNTEKKSLVLLNWDEFPAFFFKNSDNLYLNGLNPVYSYGYNFINYLMLDSFFRARTENFYEIPGKFNADYAVLNRAYSAGSIELIQKRPEFADLVYENKRFYIFRFRKGVPPETKR